MKPLTQYTEAFQVYPQIDGWYELSSAPCRCPAGRLYSSHILRNISQSTLFTATVMWDITWCKSCRITTTVPTMIFQQDDALPHYIQRPVLVATHCFLANGLDMRDMLHNPFPQIWHVEILVSVDLCGMWLCFPMPAPLCGLQQWDALLVMVADYGHFYRFRMNLSRLGVLPEERCERVRIWEELIVVFYHWYENSISMLYFCWVNLCVQLWN